MGTVVEFILTMVVACLLLVSGSTLTYNMGWARMTIC